ncbi:class I adenylate-forming enzyme family protein [Nocardioides daejeonensis]|uniref:class I adenylate-forming enzyme family protein n=1 Tax=Nocardioides daejeonensis TaxID=1046556 RepID=UPI000D740C5B|nr:AMP-binding protein [Nocardioides daejeonensis]
MTNTVADLLSDAARAQGADIALVEAASGRSLTWSALDAEVDQVVTGLGEAGLVAGYRVMLVLGNRIEFVTAYLGALRAQLVVVPANPRSTAAELGRMLADCGARLVIADDASVGVVREAVSRGGAAARVVVVGTPGEGELGYGDLVAHGEHPPMPQLDPEATAVLLYTSGTSGPPRGAMLSHRALLANIEQVASVDPPMLTATDVVLGVLPLFHVYGLNAVLGATLHRRAKLVLADTFSPDGTLDLIDDEAISVVPVAPPVFAHWLPMEDLAVRLGAVRLVLSGSAPLPAEVIDRFVGLAKVAVHQGYGLTEAAPVVTSTLCSGHADSGSVGTTIPGIELRLIDEDGAESEPGDPGEIEIRGANLFSGYWPDGADGPDAEGWWRTGDVGLLDDDGDLFLVDRVKELVIVSGFNVYPVEVEEVISAVPGVREVAVIGAPHETTGETVVAYLVIDGEEDAVRAAVAEACTAALARFKQPTEVQVVPALPHTATGKVQKGRLRAAVRRRGPALLAADPS